MSSLKFSTALTPFIYSYVTEQKKERLEVDAQLRHVQQKLDIEVASRLRLEQDWQGVSSQKGEIETSYTNMMGEKVKLEAQVALLTQQLGSRAEVSMLTSVC